MRRLLGPVRAAFANWYWWAPLAWVVVPSSCPPRTGIGALANLPVTVRLRRGGSVRCRLNEVFNVVECLGLGQYDVGGRLDGARVVVDVGANVGAATLWFARRAPESTVVAIEPHHATAARLRDNVRANGLEARVRVVEAALGSRPGTSYLVEGYSSALARTVDEPRAGTRPVHRLTLDGVLRSAGIGHVDVLKVDCEGAEYDVLLGACLDRVECIVGEYSRVPGHSPDELWSSLESRGFTVTTRDDGAIDAALYRRVDPGAEAPALGLFTAVRASPPAPAPT